MISFSLLHIEIEETVAGLLGVGWGGGEGKGGQRVCCPPSKIIGGGPGHTPPPLPTPMNSINIHVVLRFS